MITVVSGLPRSGTSLMMQMLKNGGMELLTDSIREADDNNSRGYFEYENVKSLQKDNKWIEEAEGKAIKIIAQLLPYVPPEYDYSVIYMVRPSDEIIKSQQKMLHNLHQNTESVDPALLEKTYTKQVNRVQQWMERHPRIKTLHVFYPEVLHHPLEQAKAVRQFLNVDLDVEKMASAVDQSMWHQKSEQV